MRVAISGSTGLIGTALCRALRSEGHEVVRLVRGAVDSGSSPDETVAIPWDPAADELDAGTLRGVDAVVNLSGRSIGARRWSATEKRELLESRTHATGLLARSIATLDDGPKIFLSASAIGFYGDRGDEELTEESPAGTGFLSGLCVAWERSTEPATEAGIRVATFRSGLVLSPKGGFLQRPTLLFKSFVGGRIGSGRQWWSWIALDDEVAAILFLLTHELSGPVNLTAPAPVTNAEFTRALAATLHRPAVLPVPRFAGRLVLGRELADEVVFSGQRVLPKKLADAGFVFGQPTVGPALRSVLG